ncbi:MAG: GPW/gp25 family protein [Lachnospiraceae bacterium]|nr:GPW/gp25 family protein [Lachnospiraceae bacterium]
MLNSEFLGRGFAFPLRVDPLTGRVEMADYEDSICQAVYIILMTRKGERVMRPDFGCDIHNDAFGRPDFETLSRIEDSVREALILWEPRIRDINVEAKLTDDGNIDVIINYVVRATNNPYNLVYPFYINEGLSIRQ